MGSADHIDAAEVESMQRAAKDDDDDRDENGNGNGYGDGGGGGGGGSRLFGVVKADSCLCEPYPNYQVGVKEKEGRKPWVCLRACVRACVLSFVRFGLVQSLSVRLGAHVVLRSRARVSLRSHVRVAF